MMQMDSGKRKSGKRLAATIAVILLALVVALTAAAGFYVNYLLNRINRTVRGETPYLTQEEADQWEAANRDENTASNLPTISEEDVTFPEQPEDFIGDEDGLVNILLIGTDRREGEGRTRSDTMLLCTFDTKRNVLTMTSFLRDLYVQIPGYRDNRLNAAYPIGGMELLDEAINTNFGVKIHGNIEVDFWQFESIVDTLGGVDVTLTQEEANYLHRRHRWDLAAGLNHLTGEQALAFSRIRYLDSDFGRTNRQRTVMTAIMKQCKSLSLTELLTLLDTLLPMVTTDMTNTELIRYVTGLLPVVQNGELRTQYIPGEGDFQYAMIRGMSVLVPDMEACREQLRESLYES